MAKNLKIKIKNDQIAAAVSLGGLKEKLAKKKAEQAEEPSAITPAKEVKPAKPRAKKASIVTPPPTSVVEETPSSEAKPRRVRARSRSVFAEPEAGAEAAVKEAQEETTSTSFSGEVPPFPSEETAAAAEEQSQPTFSTLPHPDKEAEHTSIAQEPPAPLPEPEPLPPPKPPAVYTRHIGAQRIPHIPLQAAPTERLGPTGRHVRDLMPSDKPPERQATATSTAAREKEEKERLKAKAKPAEIESEEEISKKGKSAKFKEYRDVKPAKTRNESAGAFDSRARQGLRVDEEQQHWRRRRQKGARQVVETAVRPTSLTVRIPITIKDLAGEMKLKASQLIEKLFLQGVAATINGYLDDATTIQLLGEEFGCQITIDTSEEERIRITDKTIKEEIAASTTAELTLRPPVVTFMGHVDHGKTSLIDAIRKSNRAAGEAGAITQHIGAFQCHTPIGNLTVIDTPGHEAFSAMRARGADVTDIVVLVVAGDEGIRAQTIEAIQHAKAAGVTIVVALNKCDKPNFNAENVYRQLSENELLPEAWGGQTITVNCSAVTGEGIPQLLEMLALQTEVLELRANPLMRARGTVVEAEMHKGLGAIASVLVQNGTLRRGDAIVFDQYWGRVKTMRNDRGQELDAAPPSTPVEITGLSGLPSSGQEFIVVSNEREAREIAEARKQEKQQVRVQQTKPITIEGLMQRTAESSKKALNVILRADVRGSLEAVKVALEKITSDKVDLNIISTGVGEISESDVQLATTSNAVVLGFHTQIESHAEVLVKQLGVKVRQHDIIFHAIDDIKELMKATLDKIEQETERGKAEVKAVFKSSQLGNIAGCQIIEGVVARSHRIRVIRNGEEIWKGAITSLRRVNEDVREIQKGFECGIVLNGFQTFQVGDILQSFEVTYITQEI